MPSSRTFVGSSYSGCALRGNHVCSMVFVENSYSIERIVRHHSRPFQAPSWISSTGRQHRPLHISNRRCVDHGACTPSRRLFCCNMEPGQYRTSQSRGCEWCRGGVKIRRSFWLALLSAAGRRLSLTSGPKIGSRGGVQQQHRSRRKRGETGTFEFCFMVEGDCVGSLQNL